MSRPDPDALGFRQWRDAAAAATPDRCPIEPIDLEMHLWRWARGVGILAPEPDGWSNNKRWSRLEQAWRDPEKRARLVEEARRFYRALRQQRRERDSSITT